MASPKQQEQGRINRRLVYETVLRLHPLRDRLTIEGVAWEAGLGVTTTSRHIAAIVADRDAYPDWPDGIEFKPGQPVGLTKGEFGAKARLSPRQWLGRREVREIIDRWADWMEQQADNRSEIR